MAQFSNNYDLEERTLRFSEGVIEFCKSTKQDTINKPIISQLVRSGTSIGANYVEANAASSRKDFGNKIFICKKEAQETRYWLKIIVKCNPETKEKIDILLKEVQELILIFQKITSTLRKRE